MKKHVIMAMAALAFWASNCTAQTLKTSLVLTPGQEKELKQCAEEVVSSSEAIVYSQVYDNYLSIVKSKTGDEIITTVKGNDFVLEIISNKKTVQKITVTSIEDEEVAETVVFEEGQPLLSNGYLEREKAFGFTEGMLKSINSTVAYFFSTQKYAIK